MLFIKKKNEYLDKEKDIYNYLEKTLRIFRILSKLSLKKKKFIEKKYLKILELKEVYNHWFIGRTFKRKKIGLDKSKIINELEELSESLIKRIRMQERFLIKDIKINDKEEDIIKQIQTMPLFKIVNTQEKELIDELVYKEMSDINNLLKILKNFFLSLKKQEDLVRNLEIETKNKEEIPPIAEKFRSDFNELINQEENEIKFCIEITNNLINESKRIFKENEIIKKSFNPEDLKEIRSLIGIEIKKEKNKLSYMQKYLNKQRQLRGSLNINRLIAIHMTDNFPNGGVIKTTGNFKSDFGDGIKLKMPRETIHFALNGVVGSVSGGDNWKGKKFVIMIPVKYIVDRIINFSSQDTFVFGDLSLPKGSEVLGNYKNLINKNAGYSKIISLPDNKNLPEAVIERIRERGYTPMSIGDHSWNSPISKVDAKTMQSYFKDMNVYSGEAWSDSFQKFANSMEKVINSHAFSVWGYLEDQAGIIYGYLTEETQPSAERVNQCKYRTSQLLLELDKKKSKFLTKEEMKSYLRIQKLMKKLLEDLNIKYPEY